MDFFLQITLGNDFFCFKTKSYLESIIFNLLNFRTNLLKKRDSNKVYKVLPQNTIYFQNSYRFFYFTIGFENYS